MPSALPPCPVAIAVRPSQRDGIRDTTRDLSVTVIELISQLRSLGYTPVLEESGAVDLDEMAKSAAPTHSMTEIGANCGLVIVLGGDGTFI